MNIIDAILMEFQYESATTRKLLERVPDAHLGWKPHEKSMTLGVLTSHIAEIPMWFEAILGMDSMDMDPDTYQTPLQTSTKALLAFFDANCAKAVEQMKGVSNERLMGNWSFSVKGETKFSMPRIGVIRSWILNHIVHHRGQLSVYLRLNNVPLPGIYGPSADEQM